jgi:hypothetical protein
VTAGLGLLVAASGLTSLAARASAQELGADPATLETTTPRPDAAAAARAPADRRADSIGERDLTRSARRDGGFAGNRRDASARIARADGSRDGGARAAPPPTGEPPPGADAPDTEPLPPDRAPEVESRLEPSAGLATGDAFTVVIRVRNEHPDDDVTVPRQSFGPYEVLDKAQVETEDERAHEFRIRLLALAPGSEPVPGVRLRVVTHDGVIGHVRTDPLPVSIASLLANEPNAEPKPPTEPVEVRQRDYTLAWVLAAIGAMLLTALVTLLVARWWRRRPRPVAPPPPPRPAGEIALEKLTQLQRERHDAIEQGRVEAWVDGLSDTLREFFGHRYGFEGLESTTDEVVAHLRRHHLPGISVPEVSALLGECDLVKFAKATLDEERCDSLLAEAFRIVRTLSPRPAGPGSASPAPSGPGGARRNGGNEPAGRAAP